MTFHVLKSVYFGCMEFKVIVYIIVGLIWVFSKLLNAKQNKKPLPPYQPAESSGAPVEQSMETVPERKFKRNFPDRTTNPRRSTVITPVSLESVIGLESATVKYKSAEKIETETGLQFNSEVQVLEDSDGQENESQGAKIAREFKNGAIDWRRAVVINELLAPRY